MQTVQNRHVLDYLRSHARLTPHKPFVHMRIGADRRTITFAQAWREVLAVKNRLERKGVAPEGVALIFLPQSWESLAHFFGAIAHGCTASYMPLPSPKQDPDLYWASHEKLMARITPATVITTAEHEAEIARNGQMIGTSVLVHAEPIATAEWAAADAADATVTANLAAWGERLPVLQHSSGTTGLKKGVMLTHQAICNQVWCCAASLDATPDDVIVTWLPVYHDMGLIGCTLMPMIVGQTIVLMDPFEWVARPATLLDAIHEHRGTLCWLPNFAYDHVARTTDLDRTSARLDSMRAFVSTSETCQPGTFRRFLRRFEAIGLQASALRTSYGMAEATFAVTQSREHQPPRTIMVERRTLHEQGRAVLTDDTDVGVEMLSVGTPIDGAEITVRTESGEIVPDGMVGEICVRSNCLFAGYYRQPEETAVRLRGDLYLTRDRGFILDGELFVLGRMDDLIIVAGRNFHATEVENVLNGIKGLKPGRNVVFAVPNADRGTADLVAVAETSDDADADPTSPGHQALRHDARHAIFQALGMYPTEVKLVRQGWLLKTTSGKIERGRNAVKYQDEKSQPARVGA
jgi:acyl-CoA synthetase (AMP-forming)/AMP-acid ligase II